MTSQQYVVGLSGQFNVCITIIAIYRVFIKSVPISYIFLETIQIMKNREMFDPSGRPQFKNFKWDLPYCTISFETT